jgi:hypothetical protein
MADKIQSFLKIGTIEEAESLRSDEQFRTLSLFNQVFGMWTAQIMHYKLFNSFAFMQVLVRSQLKFGGTWATEHYKRY